MPLLTELENSFFSGRCYKYFAPTGLRLDGINAICVKANSFVTVHERKYGAAQQRRPTCRPHPRSIGQWSVFYWLSRKNSEPAVIGMVALLVPLFAVMGPL